MPDGDCVNATTEPAGNLTLHTPLAAPSTSVQLMPLGTLVMLPLPREAGDAATESVTGAGGASMGGVGVGVSVGGGGVGAGAGTRYVASTVRCPVIVTMQGFPIHAELHA